MVALNRSMTSGHSALALQRIERMVHMSKKALAFLWAALALILLISFAGIFLPHTAMTPAEAQDCLDRVFVSPVIGNLDGTASFFLEADFPLDVCRFTVTATDDAGKQVKLAPDSTIKGDNTIRTDDWTFYSNLGSYQNVVLTMTISNWGRPIATRSVSLYAKP